MFGQILQRLRNRLILLFAIVLIVPSAFGIAAAIDRYRDQVGQARESTVRYAILASNYESNLLWQSEQIAKNLARDGAIQDAALESTGAAPCAEALRDAIRPYPAYGLAALYDLEGVPLCQSASQRPLTNPLERQWFQNILQKRTDAVSGYVFSDALQQPVLAYGSPVLDADGSLRGVIELQIRLQWLSAIGQEPGLPTDSAVYLLDQDGNVLVTSEASQGKLDNALPDSSWLSYVITGTKTMFDAVGQDGVERNYAVSAIGDHPLYILLGQPSARLIEPLSRDLIIQITALCVVSIAGMSAALVGSRFLVTRWIEQLSEAARSMRVVELANSNEFRGAPVEFRELSETLSDMAARIEARESDLKVSLAQKQMMLREIHHRVKNNLQIVASLLNLYARIPRGEAIKQAFSDVQMRINALALVHRHLYESQDIQEIDLAPFMTNLCHLLQDGSGVPPRRVKLHIDMPSLKMTGERAVPLALLTTEILTNAFKHAFPNQRAGNIYIRLAPEEGGRAMLTIMDDGVGRSSADAAVESSSMGQTLITAFTKQLGGEIAISGSPGTTCTLHFSLAAERVPDADELDKGSLGQDGKQTQDVSQPSAGVNA